MQYNHKYLTSAIIAIFIGVALSAQTFSPQSQFGIGNMHSTLFSANKGMGGIAAGFRSSRDINYLNPASYSEIKLTTFDIGAHMHGNVISDSTLLTNAANGGINHIALAFPVMQNRWGMVIGLLPFSYKKYTYNSSIIEDGVEYNFQSRGTGSTYQLFWGNGFQYKNFSAGVNSAFVFGQLDQSENILFADSLNNINSTKHNEISLKDFTFNFGVQYKAKINRLENEDKDHENIYMTVGAYGAPSFNVRTLASTYTSSSFISNFTNEEVLVDTAVGGVFDERAQTKLPSYFGAGVTFGNETKWTAGADFHFENWKSFNSPISDLSMANEWHVKIGGQILPNYKSKKYGSNVTYRLGAHFGKSRVTSNGSAVPEFGTTFGFGLPFGKAGTSNYSISRLNLTVEIGRRGIVSDFAQKENYYKVTIAYSLSDRWFIKRKFD